METDNGGGGFSIVAGGCHVDSFAVLVRTGTGSIAGILGAIRKVVPVVSKIPALLQGGLIFRNSYR